MNGAWRCRKLVGSLRGKERSRERGRNRDELEWRWPVKIMSSVRMRKRALFAEESEFSCLQTSGTKSEDRCPHLPTKDKSRMLDFRDHTLVRSVLFVNYRFLVFLRRIILFLLYQTTFAYPFRPASVTLRISSSSARS